MSSSIEDDKQLDLTETLQSNMLTSAVARVILLGGGGKLWHSPEVLQFFNDNVYPMRISVKKLLIKVAIYEIYGMKRGGRAPKFTFGGHGPLGFPSRRL